MSLNTFGDINLFPHHPDIFYPIEDEEGVDEFTHSQTDDPTELFGVAEAEYGEELDRLAGETLDDDPDLLADE
ncbi:MAG TPA: hypothetical protein VF281_01065 [Candidatus Saccharimonadales bacterium]